jgi:hypothetical protein
MAAACGAYSAGCAGSTAAVAVAITATAIAAANTAGPAPGASPAALSRPKFEALLLVPAATTAAIPRAAGTGTGR